MLYTSAEANKLLRALNEERLNIENLERQSSTYHCAMGENPDSVRPEYDYQSTQDKLLELEAKVRKIKHSINLFNISNIVPDFDMTIDEILVYVAQLSNRKQKLYNMMSRLPKSRDNSYHSNSSIIDYIIVNYDLAKAREDYANVSDELSRVQTALDLINNSVKFEIDI